MFDEIILSGSFRKKYDEKQLLCAISTLALQATITDEHGSNLTVSPASSDA